MKCFEELKIAISRWCRTVRYIIAYIKYKKFTDDLLAKDLNPMEKLLALPKDHAVFVRDPSLLILAEYFRENGDHTMDVKPISKSEVIHVIPERPSIKISYDSRYIEGI